MKDKKGVSLVILVITIIVMAILAGSVVTVTTSIVYNSRKAAFGEDLQQIQDAVETYYINNKTLPIKYNGDQAISYDLASFKGLPVSARSTSLEEELDENKDSTTTLFYAVDLAKLDVTSTTRGNGLADEDNTNDTDIYVVSSATRTIYYAKGEKIGSTIYFSLTSKLVDVTKVEDNEVEDTSNIDVTALTNVRITKSTEMYTNSLTINVYRVASLGENEKLTYKFDGTGVEGITLNLVELTNANSNITLDIASVTGDNLIAFNANKKIIIQKVNATTGEVVQTMKVSISNLDIVVPTMPEQTSLATDAIKYYTSFNTIALSGAADNASGSGLKELRYEYVTKLNATDEEVPYYDSTVDITESYLLSIGKKVDVGIIKLPKEIKSIKVIAVDNAGNTSAITEYEIPTEPAT